MRKIEERFGDVVRSRRKDIGLSQEAFADKAKIHRTYMSTIERGKVHVSIVIAEKIAGTLEIPLSELFKDVEALGESEKRRPKPRPKN